MDDFQTKPIRPADLLAAIDRVLRIHSSRQSRRRDLLDAPVLLAACGGDPTLLRKCVRPLTARVRMHLASAAGGDARPGRAAPARSGSQMLSAWLSGVFRRVAGDLAGSLEEAGGRQHSLIKPPPSWNS